MTKDGQTAPSGIDIIQMTSHMSRIKAKKFAFGHYDAEDISQEIFLIINKVCPKYDPSRSKNPKTFFNVATENALKNLRRDTRIIDNINIHDRPIDQLDNSFEEFLELKNLIEYLVVNIKPKLRSALIAMINQGGAGLAQYTKTKVREAVSKLLEQCRNE
jgi:DNA-directed RNA polymerase specialized sigma24 family protein